MAYVIIKTGGDKNYEKSEDPLYVLENSLPIDVKVLLGPTIDKAIGKNFHSILGETKTKELLTGSHTRTIKVAARNRWAFKVCQKSEVCVSCRTPLKKTILELYVQIVSKMGKVRSLWKRPFTNELFGK